MVCAPLSSPNFPGSFSVTSPEVLSLWNLTAIQGFPGSFPDFPGSSPNFPGGFPHFPGGQPLFLGRLTPSLDSQKLPLKYINNSPGFFGAGANTSATCTRPEMSSFKNSAHMRKMIPINFFLYSRECEYRPRMYSHKNYSQDFFPACIGFVPGGYLKIDVIFRGCAFLQP